MRAHRRNVPRAKAGVGPAGAGAGAPCPCHPKVIDLPAASSERAAPGCPGNSLQDLMLGGRGGGGGRGLLYPNWPKFLGKKDGAASGSVHRMERGGVDV